MLVESDICIVLFYCLLSGFEYIIIDCLGNLDWVLV